MVPMLTTRITEFFGVERPIVQGGLMWVAKAELVSAVSNAGGMGFITALPFPAGGDPDVPGPDRQAFRGHPDLSADAAAAGLPSLHRCLRRGRDPVHRNRR